MISSESSDEDDNYARLAPIASNTLSTTGLNDLNYVGAYNDGYTELQDTFEMAQPNSKGVVLPGDHVGTQLYLESSKRNSVDLLSVATKGELNNSVISSRRHPEKNLKKIAQQVKTQKSVISTLELSRHERYSLYVLLARCVALPFNAVREPEVSDKMQLTLTLNQFEHIKSRFVNLMRGQMPTMRYVDSHFLVVVHKFFDQFLRSFAVLRLVKRGGMTASDLKDVFYITVCEEVAKMGLKEMSTVDQIKSKWMGMFSTIMDGHNCGLLNQCGSASNKKDQTMTELKLMFNVKGQVHNKLAQLMMFHKMPKLIASVEVELKERHQMEHDPDLFKMPTNWANEDMDYEISKALYKQTCELQHNLESIKGSTAPVEEDTGDVGKYLSKLNYKIKKTKGWVEERSGYLGTDNDFALGSLVPEFTITIKVDHVSDLELPNEKTQCMVSAQLKGIKGGYSKRLTLETSDMYGFLTGINEEATFTSGSPLPLLEMAVCSKGDGKLSKSIHTFGKTEFQIYPDRLVANPGSEDRQFRKVYQLGTKREVKVIPNNKNKKKVFLPPFNATVTISMSIPSNVKCTGEMYLCSKEMTNNEWKWRCVILLEASRANFVMSCYKVGVARPVDVLPLDGFNVEYVDLQEESLSEVVDYPKIDNLPEGVQSSSLFYFRATRGKLVVEMATVSAESRVLWCDKLSIATRQVTKPEPPVIVGKDDSEVAALSAEEMEYYAKLSYLSPTDGVDTHQLYKRLLEVTLDFKIKDPYRSMAWFSSSQKLMIDEFCARYAIRCTERYFEYLKILLRKALQGAIVDPSVLHMAFVSTSASFRSIRLPGMSCGNVSELLGFFTQEEFNSFYSQSVIPVEQILEDNLNEGPKDIEEAIEKRLMETMVRYLLKKISNFTKEFPYGKPVGAFESCIALLERIMSEQNPLEKNDKNPYTEIYTNRVTTRSFSAALSGAGNAPVSSSSGAAHQSAGAKTGVGSAAAASAGKDGGKEKHKENMSDIVLLMVETTLNKAALHDFGYFTSYSQTLKRNKDSVLNSYTKAQCVDNFKAFLAPIITYFKDLETYYSETFSSVPGLLKLYVESMMLMMFINVNQFMSTMPIDTWETFAIYQQLNTYFVSSRMMSNTRLHGSLCTSFTPVVLRYMETIEHSIASTYSKNIAKETWVSQGGSCFSSEDVFWKIQALKNFIDELRWPHAEFAQHLSLRMALLGSTAISSVIKHVMKEFHSIVGHLPKNRTALIPPEVCVMINVVTRSDEIVTRMGIHKFLMKEMNSEHKSSSWAEGDGKNKIKAQTSALLINYLETMNEELTQIFEGALNEHLAEIAKFDNKTTFIYSIYAFGVNLKTKVKSKLTFKRNEDDADDDQATATQSLLQTAPIWLVKWLTTGSNATSEEFDLSTSFIEFLRNNLAIVRENVRSDEYIYQLFKGWYNSIIAHLLEWTSKRSELQLDVVQLNTVNSLLKKCYRSFMMENITIKDLESDDLKLLRTRLTSEEYFAERLGKGNMLIEHVADSDDEENSEAAG